MYPVISVGVYLGPEKSAKCVLLCTFLYNNPAGVMYIDSQSSMCILYALTAGLPLIPLVVTIGVAFGTGLDYFIVTSTGRVMYVAVSYVFFS